MEIKIKIKAAWKPTVKVVAFITILASVVYLHPFSLSTSVFVLYLALVILFSINSQISISLGLIFLVISSIPLIIKQQVVAETYAKYAYTFLTIGVGTALVEYLRNSEKN